MNAPIDILPVTTACLELLRELPAVQRRRVLSALTAVVDLTEEPRAIVGVDPAPGPDQAAMLPVPKPGKRKCGPRISPGKGIPRAQRLADAEAKRQGVLYAVQSAGPTGTTPKMVESATGIDRSTTGWHLRRLLRQGAIVSTGTGNTVRYYLAKELPAEPAPKASSEAVMTMLEAVAPDTVTSKEIAAKLDLTQDGASYHLRRLAQAGLVEKSGSTTNARYRATSSATPADSSTTR